MHTGHCAQVFHLIYIELDPLLEGSRQKRLRSITCLHGYAACRKLHWDTLGKGARGNDLSRNHVPTFQFEAALKMRQGGRRAWPVVHLSGNFCINQNVLFDIPDIERTWLVKGYVGLKKHPNTPNIDQTRLKIWKIGGSQMGLTGLNRAQQHSIIFNSSLAFPSTSSCSVSMDRKHHFLKPKLMIVLPESRSR